MDRIDAVQATEEERAAIRAMLSRGAESAPAGAAVGRAPAVAWAGLRLAAMVLLAAGVVAGYADGDELDEVGCTVAQQPEGKKAEMLKAEMLKPEDGGQGPEHPTSNIQHRTPNVGAEGKAYEGRAEMLKAEMLKPEGGNGSTDHGLRDYEEGKAETLKAEMLKSDESLSLAAKVFELLTALDPGNRLRKAPPIKVFNLYYRQNFSRSQIARACGCSQTLVAERLRSIREKLPWQPHQLRELSGQVEAMEETVSDSRARKIYRKGAVYGGEEEEEGGGGQ